MSSQSPAVLFEQVEPGIALVTLNRPDSLNAINQAVALQLDAARCKVEADPNIRVAILAATGDRVFSAGADLKELSRVGGASGLSTEEGGFAGFVRAARNKPWIAAVRGKALGGGFELVLACDLVVAGHSAEFALPEARIGVLAAAGGAFRLGRVMPRALANELLLTARPLTAERALGFGLVNQLTDDGEVVVTAIELARDVLRSAPLSVQASLDLVRQAPDLDELGLWQVNDRWVERIVRSRDAREGPQAFLEKRVPSWRGC